MTDISLQHYYYGEQIKRYVTVFMAIFANMKVAVGKNNFNSATNLVKVPISYASKDRTVAAFLADFTQNKPIRVPTMSAYVNGIALDPALRVGTGTEQADVRMPFGGTMPDDLTVIHKKRPVPYELNLELAIYASNTDQHFQMLEQILMLFDPQLEIQTSDDFDDWNKKTYVRLDGIQPEEAHPSGASRRVISTTFNFSMPIGLSPPFNLKADYIKEMRLKLSVAEFDQDTQEVALEDAENSKPDDYTILFSVDGNKSPVIVSVTPTPSITPTHSPTPTPTITPTPSNTPSPTPSVTPT